MVLICFILYLMSLFGDILGAMGGCCLGFVGGWLPCKII